MVAPLARGRPLSPPACLDLTLPRPQWSEALRAAERRGCFRGAVRSKPLLGSSTAPIQRGSTASIARAQPWSSIA